METVAAIGQGVHRAKVVQPGHVDLREAQAAALPAGGVLGVLAQEFLRFLGADGEDHRGRLPRQGVRSEEHTSELQSLMRISYAVFCLKKKKITTNKQPTP